MKKMYQFRTTLGGEYEEGESYDVFSKIIVTEDKLQSLKEAVIKEINQRHTQWQEIVSKALETEDVKEFFSLLYSATEENEELNFDEWVKEGTDEYFPLTIKIRDLVSLQLQIDSSYKKLKEIDEITNENISDINEVWVIPENNLKEIMFKIKQLLVMKREIENWKPITEFPEDIEIVEVFLYE